MTRDLFADPGAWWLALDASTYGGTVAVLRGRDVAVARDVAMRGEREERLMPAVVDALGTAGVAPNALAGVICGDGPGSFTSLRIAASIAKGIAHAAGVPLHAAPSLALLVAARPAAEGAYVAAMDALRGDSYAAAVVVDAAGQVASYEYLGVVPTATLDDVAAARRATIVTPAAGGTERPLAPRADAVAALGALLGARGAVDLDAWEPNYGRKAEAQVKWEAAHGRELPAQAAPA